MCAFLNPDLKQWIEIVAECLTGVGTVGAVIVALYFHEKIDGKTVLWSTELGSHQNSPRTI